MGKPYGHQYCTVEGSRHGEMKCGACGLGITDGEYRVYQRSKAHDWYYVTHHKACCLEDPAWGKRAVAQEKHDLTVSAIEASVAALFKRFGPEYEGFIRESIEDYGAAQ